MIPLINWADQVQACIKSYCHTLIPQDGWVAANYTQKELNVHNFFKDCHFSGATKCAGSASIYKMYLHSISRWGNHFLVITFFGLFFISPSYFHKTLWGTLANASLNDCSICSGNDDTLMVEPNVKKITPWGESSIKSNMSLNIK